MDFVKVIERQERGVKSISPSFKVRRSRDLLVRSGAFQAIFDPELGLWSTDEFDVVRMIDNELHKAVAGKTDPTEWRVNYMENFTTKAWREYKAFVGLMPDTRHELDSSLTFRSQKVKKTDYASKRLPYDLDRDGTCDGYDELMDTLFSPEEREKLEWAVGSIFAGDSKRIQKFIVMYGEGGTGKSTFLNIVQMLFEGYSATFDAKALTGNNNTFSTEVFKSNPLVAIQHDGDLSRIQDNSKLNSIVSHELMTVNEKFKPQYTMRANAMLFVGTNTPVKITDSRSGLIRRLIDVYPTGRKIPARRYHKLMDSIEFELGAIAARCLDVYLDLGRHYFDGYIPIGMMYQTDLFYNFVEDSYFIFSEADSTTLKQAYEMYKTYLDESGITANRLPKYRFKVELQAYFESFEGRGRNGHSQVRNLYTGFKRDKFTEKNFVVAADEEDVVSDLGMTRKRRTLLDDLYSPQLAQYANDDGIPYSKWEKVNTTLRTINTTKLHFVLPPQNHVVIDFDIKDSNGNKSLEANLRAAASWPKTYAEVSKSGQGIHLHYIYTGDTTKLDKVYAEGVEVLTFTGLSSLRRKVTKANDIPVQTLSSGLPFKKEKPYSVDKKRARTEKSLRELIERNLRKEIHPATKPSVDFIHKLLEDAYSSDLVYDLRNMKGRVLAFAAASSNNAAYCLKKVDTMQFVSEKEELSKGEAVPDDELVFYDVEVFENLFLVSWKRFGPKNKVVTTINPTPSEIEGLLNYKLVGFNNRRYDNHILYARFMGYTNEQLFALSKALISNSRSATFREAYGLSYVDIYDFSSKKQSLKKFEIDLGIHHMELGLRWDEPVDEKDWKKVSEYCENDVIATEQVFLSRKQDYVARLILAKLSGLAVNDTTSRHTAQIIFNGEKNHKDEFIYTDLSKTFPGYTYDPTRRPKSLYLGEDPSEGGYVYAEPGMYRNVLVLDVASEHPTSLIELNLFGDRYTRRFKDLLDARLAIKHKDFDTARSMLDGALAPYLTDESDAKDLSYALKIVINIVYGLTSASFENPFNDKRNKDNIVAKRGALFMIRLQKEVQRLGYKVVHIKTDSIKLENPDQKIIDFVIDFGKKYGYTFEVEDMYEDFCLVNNAVYIAKKKGGKWTATGAQFAHPFVFKTLFSGETLVFDDFAETKSVTTAIYLDYDETPASPGKEFVGKVSRFVPIREGCGGGTLLREKDGKFHAVTGTKGYRWMEAEIVRNNQQLMEGCIDKRYFDALAEAAIKTISKFGDFDKFVKGEN